MSINTISPSTGKSIFAHPGVSPADLPAILTTASDAFTTYRKTTLAQRKTWILAALEHLARMKETLCEELTAQMGRPAAFAGVEIDTMRKRADYMLGMAETALGDMKGQDEEGFKRWTSQEPVGPVLIVSAWNFPYLITINTIVPALLAGCPVLLKPSPQTPLVADRFLDAFAAANLPAGVFQVLHTGTLETVQQAAQHPSVQQVCFTGSTAGGLAMKKATVDRVVGVNLELGGKDPAYVRADADLKWTAANIVDGAVFNSGQSCCAIERVYVHADVHDAFVAELQKELEGYKLGDPADKATTVGPVISATAVKAITAQVDDALSKGAVDATPANASFQSLPATGSYVAPRLLTNVNHSMDVMTVETFGPIIPVMKVGSDEEAVALMNDSEYGLTASIWTRDVARAEEIGEDVEAGTLFVNRADCPNPDLAWVGWKNSGLGCTLGPRGFDAFVKLRSHHIRLTHG
ncbi:aldehyde dehydrogenase (NAD) family protein (Eurofung) [Akanthomyces lecanii RCEF 1005]|uniref:aldehyde dehydrogenase (NAD(+)) n=1 Tax=Akanthomyces lecanii RCEF 1005 TaxID=1081108 RepID=A0A162JSE9_CORDF|nr:aldehyde dehydrogenase (NAD) family protein (Eurofung) [Akanthomyces lecanii RCEF 1005]